MTTALTLYEVHEELQAWSNSLELAETDEQRAEIRAHIWHYLQAGREKVDRFNQFLAHAESQIELAKLEEERIATWRRGVERTVERLEGYAVWTMEGLDVRKLPGETSTLSLRKKPDAVEITNAEIIPDTYKAIVVRLPAAEAQTILEFFPKAEVLRVDTPKAVLLKALQNGEQVEGAHLKTNDDHGRGHNSLKRG